MDLDIAGTVGPEDQGLLVEESAGSIIARVVRDVSGVRAVRSGKVDLEVAASRGLYRCEGNEVAGIPIFEQRGWGAMGQILMQIRNVFYELVDEEKERGTRMEN